jgi:hypothetical protein
MVKDKGKFLMTLNRPKTNSVGREYKIFRSKRAKKVKMENKVEELPSGLAINTFYGAPIDDIGFEICDIKKRAQEKVDLFDKWKTEHQLIEEEKELQKKLEENPPEPVLRFIEARIRN